MARKTADLDELVKYINNLCSDSALPVSSRQAAAMILEHLLMVSDAYKGFRYLDGAAGYRDPWHRSYYWAGEKVGG